VTLADSTTLGADLTIAKSSWLREPLLHFAVLAGLLFLADYQASRAQKHEIVVSRQTAEYLIKQREDLKMRELSAEERHAAIDQFIEEEILYNEAYKRGLDRGDSRMRRNLILKMRGLLASEVDDPSEEELLAWYRQNIDRYTISESWSFEQVFFSDPAAVPDSLLIRLREGLDPAGIGEVRIDVRREMLKVTQRQIAAMFGPDSARTILTINDDRWHGPFESPVGVHFIRVTAYQPAREMPFEQVERYLMGDWVMAQNRRRVEREIESLRGEYDIVVEGAPQ
jgi:hypothetical protein